ncbi:MAG TPA: hypothetical protein VMS64_10040 [Candidatus Methylomirabilis sp.]|nr:hypothetical protein [Candidatus Methylomirabilis sp.]
MKFTVVPPATAAAAGVPVQEEMATGVTPLAAAPPLFFTARVAVNTWPVLTVVALGVSVAVMAAAAWAVTPVLPLALIGEPVFASVPVAIACRVSEPAPVTVQVQVKVPLPTMVWGTPVTAPQLAVPVDPVATEGVTEVMLAPAVPEFVTVSVMASCSPTLTRMGLPAIPSEARMDAGDWMVTLAGTAPVETAALLLASVPLAEAERLRVPVVVEEQLV